ncbi:MAG: electron transport complex subunit RsxD [Gammaproteobacteria bacterium]|nr:electron transport complex subunit RsxD [Gammaproteobacteria bacterium]MBU1556920.1 electron transport complex subunit RsxD [Gammaproteobacteria bacterium]MBU2071215.1 electron transport complex subunit RsxD [Gammaproteobacteria bacterium]MBU2182120.1 electron transport complex subunit RsxD [Gammaproteobacteria bacterium]MBU2205391.1 electron transport complex subunit RsxD [Gammaproteobacteria bacterium]
MSFRIASSPHQHNQRSTAQIMRMVTLACLPGIVMQAVMFGYGVLIQLLLAIVTAWLSEAAILKLRNRPVLPRLKDNSALLTAVLLAVAIPPYAPWWLIVIGTAFAIIMVKQLYGGLGNNLFNPAMAAYVLLLVSFPLQMTQWLPPASLQLVALTPFDALCSIFSQYSCSGFSLSQLQSGVDGTTMATPLDTLRTDLSRGLTLSESMHSPVFYAFAGSGWLWVNLAYLAGGLLLIQQKIISWRIPVAVIASMFLLFAIASLVAPDSLAGPLFHLFSGGTMLAAFFIATDPVSASTTDKGRLLYGALIGVLIFLIRSFGGYPDAIAFAVLLANMTVPLIDYYTRPRTYGHRTRSELK